MSQPAKHFSEQYEARLQATYPHDLVEQITNWREAPLDHYGDQTIPYIRLNEGASERPVFCAPGFVGGIVATAPFAAELAMRGHDVIVPDQNRSATLVHPITNKKDAMYTDALNNLAVLHYEDIGESDVVTHSYGSLIFDQMLGITFRNFIPHFIGAKAVLMAPAGIYSHESMPKQLHRLIISARAEGKTHKDFPEDKEMLQAGVEHFAANKRHSLREAREAVHRHLEFLDLAWLGQITVLSFAEDRLYPAELIEPDMRAAVDRGMNWATPVSTALVSGQARLGRDASHNEHQFNPSRPAAAVDEILRS